MQREARCTATHIHGIGANRAPGRERLITFPGFYIKNNMKIQLKNIEQNNGQLKGLPKNPRYIKEERYEALKQSLTDDPEMTELRELVVYPLPDIKGKYIAIGGNQRLKAMKDLGWKEAEAIVLKKETPLAKLREYAKIDNFIAGRFDWDMIANDWEEVELKQDGMLLDWDDVETLDESLFDQDENSGAKGEKEPSASLRVVMPDGTTKETETAVREIVLQVIENFPGVTIV